VTGAGSGEQERRRPRRRHRSLTRQVVQASAVALVVIAATGVGTALTVRDLDAARSRQTMASTARQSASAVLTRFVDEETGLRGFLVTTDPRFLEPYESAGASLPNLELALRRQSSALGVPEDLLTASELAHQAWISYALRQQATVLAGDLDAARSVSETLRGKVLFDAVRSAMGELDRWLQGEESRGDVRAEHLKDRLVATMVVGAAALVSGLAFGCLVLWRSVTLPLAHLARASRAVTEGDLSAPLPSAGAPEVRDLAQDVGAMRDRLTADLWRTRRALDAVAQNEPALAALQRALLPGVRNLPDLQVHARVEPAEGVLAGDWYDVVELSASVAAVVVGDVAGHGPASAVLALRLKHSLATAARQCGTPAAALSAVHGQLRDVDAELFATVFLAVVDRVTDTVTYASAGHPPGLLLKPPRVGRRPVAPALPPGGSPFPGEFAGEVGVLATEPALHWQELSATGPLLSPVLHEVCWEETTLPFETGDTLLLYTDGVLESRNAAGSEFGVQGVLDAVTTVATQPAHRLVDAIEAAALRHSMFRARQDDHTIVVLQRSR
jgi:sigma-B regulation protein RsbU (phosphoserine phosphatase)